MKKVSWKESHTLVLQFDVCYDIHLAGYLLWGCLGKVLPVQSGEKYWIAMKMILIYLRGAMKYYLCYQGSDLCLMLYTNPD